MAADPAAPRSAYRHWLRIPTRWMDNDIYGHVNNVVYYSYFDTVINTYLISHGGLDIHQGSNIGLCVESQCRFLAPLAFPQAIDAGLGVERLGRSSVRYTIGLFAEGDAAAAAEGWFVHVFVDRETRRPVPVEGPMRVALEGLVGQEDKARTSFLKKSSKKLLSLGARGASGVERNEQKFFDSFFQKRTLPC